MVDSDTLDRIDALQLEPASLRFYKPSVKDTSGSALSLQLRLVPEFGDTYVGKVGGGLFVELVPQATVKTAQKDATFGWEDPQKVTSKFGIADISALLVAIRCRYARRPIPKVLRTKGDDVGNTVGLFHRFVSDGKQSTTVIEYSLVGDDAYLRMSKSAELRRVVKLTMSEELQLEAYLQHALKTFILVGKR